MGDSYKRVPETLAASWEGTLLATITQDLLPLIFIYHHALDKPGLKLTEDGKLKPYSYARSIGNGVITTPDGIVLDESGEHLYVTDRKEYKILVFSLSGTFQRSWGGSGRADGQFSDPTALMIDWSGNLAVLDNQNARVQVFDPNTGTFLRKFGKQGRADGEISNPHGITTDINGNYLIADSHNGRLQIFTPTGVWLKSFGSLMFPIGVAIDKKTGNILVSDNSRNCVRLFDREGIPLQSLVEDIRNPRGILVDRNGYVIVSVAGENRVVVFSMEGQKLMEIGLPDGALNFPMRPMLDREGNLYITEFTNGRISVWE